MVFTIGDNVEGYWRDDAGIGYWWPARVLNVLATRYRVTFDNYDSSWDMYLPRRYVRKPPAAENIEPQDDGESADGETDSDSTSESEEFGVESARSDTSSELGAGDGGDDEGGDGGDDEGGDGGESAVGETDSDSTSESEEFGVESVRSDTSSELGAGDGGDDEGGDGEDDEDGNAGGGGDVAVVEVRSNDGREWTTKVPDQFVRAPARNIIRVGEGNKGRAAQIGSYVDAFKCLIDDAMIADIVRYTNLYGSRKEPSFSPVTATEIHGIIGLLFMIGVLKGQHQPIRDLLANGREVFRVAFGINRFEQIIGYLRFDDRTERIGGQGRDKFAPFRLFFDKFIQNCRDSYNPGPFVCVDEQLIPYRGRCPFKQYLPSKPDKYGMKLFLLVTVRSHYVLNGVPYCGRDPDGGVRVGLGQETVLSLVEPYGRSGINVTTDNYFTSANLADDLNTRGMTLLGTIRKTRKEVPVRMRTPQGREIGSSVFCFSDILAMCSYVAKRNKCVTLLSSMHSDNAIDEETGKPEMILEYNRTKGSVDAGDQLAHSYSVQKRTRRWPLAYFYNCLNLAGINAFALYKFKFPDFQMGKTHRRRLFLEALGMALLDDWLSLRANIEHMNKPIVQGLKRLGYARDVPQPAPQALRGSKRRRCAKCPTAADRKTSVQCQKCQAYVCKDHSVLVCSECFDDEV